MKRLFLVFPLALAAGSTFGQSGTNPSDVLDRMSIFSRNRAASAEVRPPLPPTGGVRAAAVPAFVGAIDEGGDVAALIEFGGASAQYIEVRAGDTIAGSYRVEGITLQRMDISDGTQSRAVEIGNDLLNQPRLLPLGPATPRGPAGPGTRTRRPFGGRGNAAVTS